MNTDKNMKLKMKLDTKQKRLINEISKRLAENQAVYLRTVRECLTKFTESVGYDSPADARQYVMELLQEDEHGCPTFLFDKADWSKSLTWIALREIKAKANAEIEARLDRLYP